MSYCSGQPLYTYTLAGELRKLEHEVTIISDFKGGLTGTDGYKLKENLEKVGVICLQHRTQLKDEYNLIIASENVSEQVLNQLPNTPVINIIHSEYEYETPIPNREQIIAYICVRYVVLEHIIKEHDIPIEKCIVIRNGVDRDRFKPKAKTPRDYYKIVVPCTLDTLREKFLNHLIDSANDKRRIFIYGFDCSAKRDNKPMVDYKSEFVAINPDKFDIQDELADADEVAGILLGRVNLEAWSCGVPSSVYHPVTLDHYLYEPPIDFNETYNIKNVTSKILSLFESLDDLTIVIPHLDATDKLKLVLDDLRKVKNVVVAKGGSFAESCELGFRSVKTEYVLFLNDDVRIHLNTIRNMLRAIKKIKDNSDMRQQEYDISGCMITNGCTGFNFDEEGVLEEVKNITIPVKYPSGCCLMMKSEVYKKLNGFNHKFINGCEDINFLLEAEQKGYKIIVTSDTIDHTPCSSSGRLDHIKYNIDLFNDLWKGKYKIRRPI
jgi:hypothetical protein